VGQHGPAIGRAVENAHFLLAYHVTIIGAAGLISLQRLRGLLEALIGSRQRALQFFWLWLVLQAFVGTQLSWILRPYLGKPTLVVQFLRADAFQGSFFEEVLRWLT
jgi:hypothetical protein